MMRSRSRSGSIDFGHKDHSSFFSKTLSASKICRGDALASQIDSNALVSLDKNPLKYSNLSEKKIDRVVIMQEQIGDLEEELRRTKGQLVVMIKEKNQSLDEIKQMKQAAREAVSPQKVAELCTELKNLKGLLSDLQKELKTKDDRLESLGVEVKKVKQLEVDLAGKDSLLDRLREELNNARVLEARATSFLADHRMKIQDLEDEVVRGKMSEMKMIESLEHTKTELEETKLELSSLKDKVKFLESSLKKDSKNSPGGSELESIKNELKMALKAEEMSKQAMDELALALTEVATQANQAKEKLSLTELELEQVKGEAEQLKSMILSTEKRYEKILEEVRKETEVYRNTADRLRLEAEESLLAWNGKEMEFVNCIKRAEEEKAIALDKKAKYSESFKAIENKSKAAKEENSKLRDILKQAINEANAAKAAAGIASDENSQLKDLLVEKDETIQFLSIENERLRINEGLLSSGLIDKQSSLKAENVEEKKAFTNVGPTKDEDPLTPKSSGYTDDGRSSTEERESGDSSQVDDSDSDRNGSRRRRALFQRVGDMIKRKSFNKKEISE